MSTLRDIRAERLLSIRDLARQAEVSPSTIYLIEAGRSRPRPSVARRIAEVLNVQPQEIEEFQRTIDATKSGARRPPQPRSHEDEE